MSHLSDLFGRRLLYAAVWSLQLVTGAIVSPFLAYTTPPAQFGLIASALALHQLLNVVTVFGLDQAIIVQRAEDAATDDGARGLITVGIAASAAATGILAVSAPWWGPAFGFGHHFSLVLAVVLWTGPGAAVQMMLGLLSSQDRLPAFTVVSLLSTVVAQVVGFAFLLTQSRLASTYAWALVLCQYAAMAAGLLFTRPRLRGLIEGQRAWRAMKFGLSLSLSSFSSFVLNAGDRIIIQRERGSVEAGRYQIAYTVGYVLVLLWMFTAQAWMPRIAAIRDEGDRMALIRRARDLIYRLFVPAIIALTLISPTALRVVAPAEYKPKPLLVIVFLVALSVFPVAASGVSGIALMANRRAKPLAIAGGVAAVVNIAINLALVPSMGITGSALATVIAFGIQAIIQRRALGPYRGELRMARRLSGEILLACAACAATVAIPQTSALNIARDVVAVACVHWFISRLRQARQGPIDAADDTPVPLAVDGGR